MTNYTTHLTLSLPETGTSSGVWGTIVNANFLLVDALFSGTGGHTHDGTDGNGPAIDHLTLSNIGTNSHDAIDAHIADSAIHADSMLATVTEVDTGNTFSNTTDIQFAGATVTQSSAGVVVVTPDLSSVSSGGDATIANAASASVAWTDNFNYALNAPLAQECWKQAISSEVSPTFVGTGTSAQLAINTNTVIQSGGVVLHAAACIPHGIAQRVTYVVTDVSGSASDGSVHEDDAFVLSLDLLSSTEYSGNTKPNKNGVCLNLIKEAGTNIVSYEVSIQAGGPGSEVIFNDFSGSLGSSFASQFGGAFQDLPVNFLEGIHEFSMQGVEDNADDFHLSYYYNGGLVFRQLFEVSSNNLVVQSFALELPNLLALLQNSDNPDYGRMGFSAGYVITEGNSLSVTSDCAMVGAQNDQTSLRAIALPAQTVTAPADPVCGGVGEFGSAGLEVGSPFDFDGALGSSNDWVISSKFDAGEQGDDNGAGFTVVQTSDPDETAVVWCDVPTSASGTANVSPMQPELDLTITSANSPMGDATTTIPFSEQELDVELMYGTAAYPTNPVSPDGDFETEGDSVPTSVIGVTSGGAKVEPGVFYTVGLEKTEYQLNLLPIAPIMPWGQTLDVKLTPKFATTLDYSLTVPDAITIVPANPFLTLSGVSIEFYDETESPAEWKPVAGNTVPEGSYIFVGAGAVDMPLGAGYWDVANTAGVPTWDVSDANDPAKNTAHVTPPYLASPSGVSLVSSKLFAGVRQDELNPTHTDTSPLTAQFDQVTSEGGQMIALTAIYKLSDTQWSDADKSFELAMHNPLTGAMWGRVTIVPGSLIVPKQISLLSSVVVEATGTAGVVSLVESTAVDMTFTVDALDLFDSSVRLVSGFDAAVTLDASDYTITDNGDNTFTVEIVNQTLGTGAGTEVSFGISNVTATQQGLDAENVIIVGQLEAVGVPGPAAAPTWTGSPPIGLTQNQADTFSIPAADVIDGAAMLEFSEPDFFRFTGPAVYNSPNWEFSAYAVQPIGLNLSTASTDLVITNPDGQTATTSFPATTLDTVPAWADLSVDGGSTWNLSTGNPKTITFTVSDALGPNDIPPTFSDSNGFLLPVGSAVGTGPTYTQDFNVRDTAVDGAQTDFVVQKAVLEGNEDVTVALSLPANNIDFTDITGIGGEFGNIASVAGAPGGNDSGSIMSAVAGGNRSKISLGDSRPSSSDSTGILFSNYPQEGHYVSIRLRGKFHPANSSGTNFTLTLEDTYGTSISNPVVIRNATSKVITGAALMSSSTLGSEVVVRLVDNTRLQTVVTNSFTAVRRPTPPRVRSMTIEDPVAGTLGTTLTIHGTNLMPPSPPFGQPALSYTVSFSNTGTTTALTNIVQVSADPEKLVYTVDIAATVGGESIGTDINYLGGNVAAFTNLVTIAAVTSGNPSITAAVIYQEGGSSDAPTAPPVGAGKTAFVTLTGTGLSALTVDPGAVGSPPSQAGVYFEIVGNEGASYAISSGNGLTETLANDRLPVNELIRQSDTSITVRVPADITYANVQARAVLYSPEYHTNGIAEWPIAATDGTGVASPADGISNPGLTVRYGDYARAPRMNVDPTQGDTQLTVARGLQAQAGPGTEGQAFTQLFRLNEAWTSSAAPTLLVIPDAVYGCQLEDVAVSTTANPFIIQVDGTIPQPGVNNSYPLGAFTSATPARVGLTLANGIPVASVLLGSADWGTDGSGVAY